MFEKAGDVLMEYYKIGYIANTLGVRGELKVVVVSNIPDRFENLKCCYIDTGNVRLPVEVERERTHKTGIAAIKLKGYDDLDSVLAFKGKYLEVDRNNLAELGEGHYFVFEIMGCRVVTTDGTLLGEVTDVLTRDAHDLYVVEGEKGEILIPAVRDMVKEIDIDKKTIRVDLPEGLME